MLVFAPRAYILLAEKRADLAIRSVGISRTNFNICSSRTSRENEQMYAYMLLGYYQIGSNICRRRAKMGNNWALRHLKALGGTCGGR